MKFKVGDRVNYCCMNGTKYAGKITVPISIVTGNYYTAMLDDGYYIYDSEDAFEFEIPQCPVVANTWVQGGSSYQAMGYGATPAVKVGVGTKVVMKPTTNPNDVGSEFAGSVGTILDVPTLFSEHYEIEMGAAHNFQHVYANDNQFEVYKEYDHYTSTQDQWKQEGLCPKCGEKGYFSNFAFVCTKHGEY